ncbi:MAG: hypothetical protein RLZ10_1620 [Bacteroidota bacterium]|jgi:glycosyltransferase involved in cell wall biosynthesis
MSWGGLEMNQIRNATWMRNRGHEVHLFVLQNSPAFHEAKKQNLQIYCIKKHRKHYDFISAYRLYLKLKILKSDCLIVRRTFDMSIAASISFFSGRKIKTLFFMEMQLSFSKKQFFRTWRYHFIDAWCCPLNYLKNQVLSNTNIDPMKVHTIPSGIDLSKIQKIDKQTSKRSFNLLDFPIVFGVLGRIDPKKGQKLVVEALSLHRNKNIALLIMGESENSENTEYLQSLKNFIFEQEINDFIKIVPFSNTINLFFSAIDALIVPSENETVGMVTIESLAYGVPIIGSNCGGTKEILCDQKLGLLFESLNVSDLQEKIINFNSKQYDSQSLIETSMKYDKEKTCNLVEDLIRSLKN